MFLDSLVRTWYSAHSVYIFTCSVTNNISLCWLLITKKQQIQTYTVVAGLTKTTHSTTSLWEVEVPPTHLEMVLNINFGWFILGLDGKDNMRRRVFCPHKGTNVKSFSTESSFMTIWIYLPHCPLLEGQLKSWPPSRCVDLVSPM